MRSNNLFYLVGLVFLISMSSHAQVGQVINIASRYATLLKSNQNDIVFEDDSLEQELEEHLHIAILPFAAHISYVNPRELTEEEALEQFETEQMLGKMFQEQFWDVFDNNPSEVYLQDVRITNKVLEDAGFFTRRDQFPPSYLAEMLQVDAVILCTFDIQIDNTRTGWQNLTKALGSLALSQVTGFVPGLDALKFIKDPQAIIKIVSNPGEFYNKLKEGDLTALMDLAGTMLPEGNWKKVAELVANNSQTIVKVAQGDTKSLFSDLLQNNIGLLSSELNLNPTVTRLIGNNAKVVDNVLAGNTQGLMFDLISNNVNTFASGYMDGKSSLLSNAINNNSTLIAKLATGDTSNLLEDVINNNIGQVTGLVSKDDQSFFSGLILNNTDLVSKVIQGDFENLTTDFISKNSNLIGELIPGEDAKKYTQLLTNKGAVQGLLTGDFDDVFSNLKENGLELFGEAFEGTDIEQFTTLIVENKSFVNSIVSGDKTEMLNFLLQNDSGLLGKTLNSEQSNQFLNILNSKGSLIQDLVGGKANDVLGGWLMGLDSGLSLSKAADVSSLILNKKDLLPEILKGDKTKVLSVIGDSKLTDFLLDNRHSLNQLVGLDANEDFSILNKSKEDIDALAFQFLGNPELLGGLISGDISKMTSSYTEKELRENLQIDPYFFSGLSASLVDDRTQISNILVNSQVSQMLLNGMIDIQFFDFGVDALLESYENAYLRDKTVSQTLASILDPSTDPKDNTKVTINIFGQDSDKILWQYNYLNEKARLYDMNKTVSAIVKRVNKRFPYFQKKKKKKKK